MLTAYPLSKLLNKWRSDRLVGGRALGLPVGSQLCTRLNNRAPAQSQPAVVGAGAPYLVWIIRTSLPSTSTNILSYTVSQIIGSCGPPSAEMIAGTVLLWPTTSTVSPACLRTAAATVATLCGIFAGSIETVSRVAP